MMHKFFLVAIIGFFSSTLFSQEDYSILADDPNYAQISAQVGIGLETDFGFRTEVPLNIDLYYGMDEIPLEFRVSRNMSVFSERESSFYIDNQSDNEYQAYNRLDIGLTFNFTDKTGIKPLPVKVASRTSGSTKTNYYMHIDGRQRNRIGARVGAYRYAQSITDYDAIDQSIEFSDGTTFPNADNAWGSKPGTDDNYFFTAERHLAGYIGVQFHKSTGLAIMHDNYGEKDAESNVFLYGDVLFNMASDIQKLSYQGILYDLTEATAGVDLNNIGFRVGAKKVESNIFYSIEFGQRPQYFSTKFYTQFSLGYSFNRNL